MYRYITFQENLFTNELGEYSAFGIKVLDGDNSEILSVSDISVDEELVRTLCSDCNENALEPVHLLDVIEDYI